MLTSEIKYKRLRGIHFRTAKYLFADNTKFVVPNVSNDYNVSEWIGHAEDESEWIKFEEKKKQLEMGDLLKMKLIKSFFIYEVQDDSVRNTETQDKCIISLQMKRAEVAFMPRK